MPPAYLSVVTFHGDLQIYGNSFVSVGLGYLLRMSSNLH